MAGGKKIGKLLLRIGSAVISVLVLALVTFSLILAKPAPGEEAAPAAKPSREASPAVTVEAEKDLVDVVSAFPAPVMSFMSGSGMTFVSATVSDAAVDGGFGRVATLYWQTPGGEPMTLRSIWPATALDLLEKGYHFMPYEGPALFGNTSVRMENDSGLRFHTATDQALYAVLLPRSLSGEAANLCRSLQLFTANTKEE